MKIAIRKLLFWQLYGIILLHPKFQRKSNSSVRALARRSNALAVIIMYICTSRYSSQVESGEKRLEKV